jgi:hypothetical protein
MPKWQRANEVPELSGAPAPSLRGTIVGIPPPPAAVVAVQAAYEQTGFPKSSSAGTNSSAAPASSAGAKKPQPGTGTADETRKSASAAMPVSGDEKKVPPAYATVTTEPKKKSVRPGAAAAPAEAAASGEAKRSNRPTASAGAVKKKSVPPPAPPAPAIRAATPATAPSARGDLGKAAQVPANAWGAPPTKPSARMPGPGPVQVDRGAASPADAVASDEIDLETWVAKPAPTAQELAAAVQAAASHVAGAGHGFPPAPQGATAAAPGAQAPSSRGSTFPLAALPPTRMTSPLPPPPRRSHPAPGATPSTAPQAFSQSSAAQMSPHSSRDGLPPSMPPLHSPSWQAPAVASPNGIAEGDLPAFPLDEIDPDDERPFRPSQGAGPATSPSGHPATLDAQDQKSDGSLRGVLAYIRANPKDPKLMVALGGGALLVVGLLGGFAAMSGAKSKGNDETSRPSIGAADPASSANAASSAALAAQSAQTSAKAAAATACHATGAPARRAEKASKDVPLELLVTSSGERVRLGFATSANAAQGVSVDLASLQVTPEFAKPPRDRLRAVIPFGEDAPEFVAQLEGHADKLKAWRTISVDPTTVIGWSGSALAVADKANRASTQLWALEGADPIDVIRAAHTSDHGHAIVFRRHGAIHAGMIGSDRAAVGELTRIAGAGAPPGSPIGTPTIAVNGQSVAVAFADRASSDEPWSLRIGSAPLGSFPSTTTQFTVPPGGPGGAALAPALSGLPDGRWFLVWTEGSGGAHDVRGVTLGADLAPVGAALTVSREGSNAGQGAVALRAGRGLVAYLALTEEGYEVWGTSVDCR